MRDFKREPKQEKRESKRGNLAKMLWLLKEDDGRGAEVGVHQKGNLEN